MKNFIISLILVLAAALTWYAGTSGSNELAILHVNVIPMKTESILKDQTVIIENGRIKAIGPSSGTKVPGNAKTINAAGKYLMPGLFDMHAHFFYEQGRNVNTCEAELKLMLANGLTTVRIQCGDSVYLEARENVRNNKWAGPGLFISSPQFVGNWPWKGKVFAKVCRTPEEGSAAVRECKKNGYDEIKITFMVKRDVYEAIVTTAREENIKVTGHVGPLVKLPAALQHGQQIEHMDEFIDMLLPDTTYNHGQSVSDMNIWRKNAWATVPYLDEAKIPALVQSVKNAGIYVTPTNFFFFSSFADSLPESAYTSRPDYTYIPDAIKEERWDIRGRYWSKAAPHTSRQKYIAIRKAITLQLAQAGVPLMAGSDSPEWFLVQGFSIHDELATFASAGLSPFRVLQTATVHPARYLGVISRKGTVETGKDADLILLDKNPLESITNTRSIITVIHGGQVYDSARLKKLLEEARLALTS